MQLHSMSHADPTPNCKATGAEENRLLTSNKTYIKPAAYRPWDSISSLTSKITSQKTFIYIMKFSILLTTLLTASAFANPAGYAPKKPLVSSKQLQRTITRSALLKHADALEHQASLSGGSRAFGSKGHNATVDYIKKSLDKTGYYDTRLQTFPYLFSEGTANFTVAGTAYNTAWLTYGPAGNVTASLVAATELGCIAVCLLSFLTWL